MTDDKLLTQTEARRQAAALNLTWNVTGTGVCHVAHPVPEGSWGGQEKGWSVSLKPVNR